MADVETKTTVRLTKNDERNVKEIIASGAATNTSEAIRVSLAILAMATKLMPDQIEGLVAKSRARSSTKA